jgi:hypothetical protein
MTKISNKNNYKKNITFKNKNKNKNKNMQKTLEGGGKKETIDDATKLNLIKPPDASLETTIVDKSEDAIIPAAIPKVAPHDAAIIPAPPKAAPPEAGLETSLVLANALIHEEKKPEECVPEIIHVLKIDPDGNCLFSSLFTGLIRLNADVPVFSEIPINQAHGGDVQAFVARHIHTFRNIIVDSLETYLNANIDDLDAGTLSELGRFIYEDGAEIDVTNKSVKQDIVTSYITNMRRASIWGDQIIIVHFIRMTNINVVIFNFLPTQKDENKNRIFTISGNFCYDGIWLYYNGSSHYDLIFPINVDRKFDIITETPLLSYNYNDFENKIIIHKTYKDLLAITTIKEDMIEQVAKPGPAKPAQAKPAEAQAKPAEAQAKPAEAPAKVKPEPAPAPAKVKPEPAKPEPAKPEQNVALRIAGALTQAPTKALTGSLETIQALTQALTQLPTQAQTKVEEQIQAPTQAQTKVKGQSEEQIQSPTQAPTKVERQSEEQIETPTRGQGGEENQIFRPDESNSGNMFVIPLMGVVLALAITFLVKK